MQSRKPIAKQFKKGVKQILHEIRTKGGYMTAVAGETPEQTMARAVMIAQATLERQKNQIEQQQQLLEEQRPKVIFADAIVGSKNSCLVGELAKILTNNGIVIGQNRLFKWLRCSHFLGTVGERYNIPNQEYVEQGIFELKKTVHDENGVMVSKVTPKVTPKGQSYFINGFISGKFKVAE